jgi:hypothetical protein
MIYFPELQIELAQLAEDYKRLLRWNLNVLYVLAQAKKHTTAPDIDIRKGERECLFPFQQSLANLRAATLAKYASAAGL